MDVVRSALQCFCCCVGVAPSAHLHKKNAWQLYLIGYTALPVACGSSYFAYYGRFYPFRMKS